MIPLLASLAEALWWALGATLTAGALCVLYGVFVERRWYRVARYRLPLLPVDGPVSILHLSDLHFLAPDRKKAAFLAGLPRADLTVITGDLVGDPAAVEAVVTALRPVRGRLASYFVLGSNDYYAPQRTNYLFYFVWRRRYRKGIRGRAEDLVAQLEADGWQGLPNRRLSLSDRDLRVEVLGLDDPHIQRQDFRPALRRDPEAFGLAITHSPDAAPELAALGYQLILAGHTHGGQVRLPLVGALVTNGTTPTRLCMGLSRIGASLMHVSPGLGTSKHAPFRFLCRPEATILELVSVPERERSERERSKRERSEPDYPAAAFPAASS